MNKPQTVTWYDVTTIGSVYAEETDGNGNWRHRPLIIRLDGCGLDPGLLLPGQHHGIGEWRDGPAPSPRGHDE